MLSGGAAKQASAGPYWVLMELGAGGTAQVELAVRSRGRFERLYALKRLHPHLRAVPSARVAADLDVSWTHVSHSFQHGCGLTAEADTSCWGRREDGRLGIPDATTEEPPARVLGDIVDVAAGRDFSCAIRASGSAMCWGSNDHGQLGAPLPEEGFASEPRELPPRRYMRVDAERLRACALEADTGQLWCWGWNAGNRLAVAEPGTPDVRTPAPVAGEQRFAQFSLGNEHGCGVDIAKTRAYLPTVAPRSEGRREKRAVPTDERSRVRRSATQPERIQPG